MCCQTTSCVQAVMRTNLPMVTIRPVSSEVKKFIVDNPNAIGDLEQNLMGAA